MMSMVLVNLDSRSSLQLDSISDLILINSTFFFSILNCHSVERKVAAVKTMGNCRSSSISKSRVRILLGVRSGMHFLRPFRRTLPAPLFCWQWKRACSRVSAVPSTHLLQIGDWLGSIFATRSAIGRILCKSLKRKVYRFGPSIYCLDKDQVVSYWLSGLLSSTLRGCSVWLPESSSIIVISSIRKW